MIRTLPKHCVRIITAELVEPGVRELIAQTDDGALWRCLVDTTTDGRVKQETWIEIPYPNKFHLQVSGG